MPGEDAATGGLLRIESVVTDAPPFWSPPVQAAANSRMMSEKDSRLRILESHGKTPGGRRDLGLYADYEARNDHP